MFFPSSLVISIFLLVNISNLLICSKHFLSFLQSYLIGVRSNKGVNWDIILTYLSLSNSKNAKNINRSACIKTVSIRSTYTRDIYAIKSTGARNIFLLKMLVLLSTQKYICNLFEFCN